MRETEARRLVREGDWLEVVWRRHAELRRMREARTAWVVLALGWAAALGMVWLAMKGGAR